MSTTGIELLLSQTMGLDAGSISSSAIARAIQTRMKICELSDLSLYENLLHISANEMQELIEIIIVPETWFFRDQEAFTTLTRLALEKYASIHPGEILRLLSLPCSTGEEPHSMAMALFDAGFPADRFRIDALDISHRSLEQARTGIYGKNSFRSGNLDFRDRHFVSKVPGWHLTEKVRRQIRFLQGNLMDDNLLPGLHSYDIIFCRNVLIYFDREAQGRVIDTLDRLLTPEGILFMGPSETSLLPPHRFIPAQLSHAFAFRKSEVRGVVPAPEKKRATVRQNSALHQPIAVTSRDKPKPLPFANVSPLPALASKTSKPLDDIMRLADEGRLTEAAAQCESHLRQEGPSAQAYYLLALIRDACGQPQEATELYRKALYLEPRNEEILSHLASLLKSQGDSKEADLLLNRARRLPSRQKV